MPKGLLAKATAHRSRVCVEACAGIPDKALAPGSVLKLSKCAADVTAEVEFLRVVRGLQAKKITALRIELERIPVGDRP